MAKLKKIFTRTPVVIALITALLATVSAIIVAIISKEPPAPIGPDIKQYVGRVLNDITLKPISNAMVTLDLPGMMPQTVYTDTQGVYLFNLALTVQTTGHVRVDASGYTAYTLNISLSTNLYQ